MKQQDRSLGLRRDPLADSGNRPAGNALRSSRPHVLLQQCSGSRRSEGFLYASCPWASVAGKSRVHEVCVNENPRRPKQTLALPNPNRDLIALLDKRRMKGVTLSHRLVFSPTAVGGISKDGSDLLQLRFAQTRWSTEIALPTAIQYPTAPPFRIAVPSIPPSVGRPLANGPLGDNSALGPPKAPVQTVIIAGLPRASDLVL